MSNGNVTVLTDEIGLQREYREIKRKAAVGERIKIVKDGVYSEHIRGTVLTVVDADHKWGGWHRDGTGVTLDSGTSLFHHRYVVLEPTDTVIIDGQRYKTVARKVNAGEHVVVVSAVTDDRFVTGGVYEVIEPSDYGIFVKHPRGRNYLHGGAYLMDEYRVLEPQTSATSAPLSSKPADTQVAEIIAKLTDGVAVLAVRVSELERRVTELETPDKAPEHRYDLVCSGKVTNMTPSFMTDERLQTRPIDRDDVIAMAKEDVADLRNYAGTRVPNAVHGRRWFWPHNDVGTSYVPLDHVEYVINREKRTVVALITDSDGVWAKGIAKCAPDDVFNTHIGRAIALRRALGLDIPEYYVKAPKPTEAKVGDIVKWKTQGSIRGLVTSVDRFVCFDVEGTKRAFHMDGLIIIDDSREEVA